MNQDLVATAKQHRALTGKLESLNSGTLGGCGGACAHCKKIILAGCRSLLLTFYMESC